MIKNLRAKINILFVAAGVYSGFVMREELSYSTAKDQFDDIIEEHHRNTELALGKHAKKPLDK